MTRPVIRILLADAHAALRLGARGLIEARSDLQVVAEASTGREALALALETKPAIAIVAYTLPELNGRDLTIELKRRLPEIEVLIYTMHDREDLIREMLQAGARGVVLKTDQEQHLVAAIDALSMHRPYFSSVISDRLLAEVLRSIPQASPLTNRERQVVQLIAEGKLNKQIAHILELSVKTVESHRASVMEKLDLRTTAELVRYAVRNRIAEA